MTMRHLGVMLLAGLVLMAWAGSVQCAEETKPVPVIEVDAPTYDFHQVAEGEVVKHDFRVFNRGTAPLEIKKVKPG